MRIAIATGTGDSDLLVAVFRKGRGVIPCQILFY